MRGDLAKIVAVLAEAVSSPWQNVTAASGFTSTVQVRQVGTTLQFRGALAPAAGNFATAANVTAVAASGNPMPPGTTRIVTCGHTWGTGSVPAVCRVNIGSDGSIVLVNIQQTSVTSVWLDGVVIST